MTRLSFRNTSAVHSFLLCFQRRINHCKRDFFQGRWLFESLLAECSCKRSARVPGPFFNEAQGISHGSSTIFSVKCWRSSLEEQGDCRPEDGQTSRRTRSLNLQSISEPQPIRRRSSALATNSDRWSSAGNAIQAVKHIQTNRCVANLHRTRGFCK